MSSSRQPELYCAGIITWCAAAFALICRIAARYKTKVRMHWEDYLSIIAFIIGTGFTFMSLFKMRWGLGRKMTDVPLDPADIVHHYFTDLFVDMWLYTFSVGLSKFVILGFLWRTFKLSVIRNPIRILSALALLWIIARVCLILTVCRPIRAFWDQSVKADCPIPKMTALYSAAIPHIFIEVGILICPMVEIQRLHLPRAQKLAVAGMFTSGFLVCGAGITSLVVTATLDPNSSDITWDNLNNQIWATCDVNLAHFSTSLPLLRPVFKSFGTLLSSMTSSTFRSTGYNSSRPKSAVQSADHIDTESTHPLAENRSSVNTEDHEIHESLSGRGIAMYDLYGQKKDIKGWDGVFVTKETNIEASKV